LSGAPRLRFELRPSPGLAAGIVALHAVAAGCVALVFPGVAGGAIAFLVAGLGAAAAWDRALLKGRRSPRALEIAPTGEAELVLAAGERVGVPGRAPDAVNRWWVSLPVNAPARRTLLIPAGMLGREEFRRLRLWALWGRVPGVASGQLPA
jgi:hypothetical protein